MYQPNYPISSRFVNNSPRTKISSGIEELQSFTGYHLFCFNFLKYNTENLQNYFDLLKFWKERTQSKTFKPTASITHYFHTTDIHGDIGALLHALLYSGAAKFKNGGASFFYFDVETKNKYRISEFTPRTYRGIKNIILLPNLEINRCFEGILTIGGDLMDRGKNSEECFWTVIDLIEQYKSIKQPIRIKYLIGNHEGLIINNRIIDSITNKFITLHLDPGKLTRQILECHKNEIYNEYAECIKSGKANEKKLLNLSKRLQKLTEEFIQSNENLIYKYKFIRTELLKQITEGGIEFCYCNHATGVLTSHAFFDKENVLITLNCAIEKHLYTKEEITPLKDKIESNDFIPIKEKLFLSQIINSYLRTVYSNPTKIHHYQYLNDSEIIPLLWNRTFYNEADNPIYNEEYVEKNQIASLKQIIGHEAVSYGSVILKKIPYIQILD